MGVERRDELVRILRKRRGELCGPGRTVEAGEPGISGAVWRYAMGTCGEGI